MNIIDKHSLLTPDQEQTLRQSASLPFKLGKYSSLDDILTKLGVDVYIEPSVIKNSGHPLGRNALLDRILDYWEKEAARLRNTINEGENDEDLMREIQEVWEKIDRIKKEKQYVGGALLRGYYNPKDNSIHLFPEEMATEYNGNRMDELLVSTLAHETMHAYFNRPGHDKFPYAYFVEEPLAEFGMLLYLHETMPGFYNWAHNDVSGKRTCYSLGAELMDQFARESYPSPTRDYLVAYKIGLGVETMLTPVYVKEYLPLPIRGSILFPSKTKASKVSRITSTPIPTGTKSTSASRNLYTINGSGTYFMYDVLEEFIKFRLDAGLSIPDIDNEIKSYIFINGTSKWAYVSDVKSAVLPSSRGTVRGFNYKGKIIYYTNQWYGNPGGNFTKFSGGVNKAYPGIFEIDRILLPTIGKVLPPKASKVSRITSTPITTGTKSTSASRNYYTINGTGKYTMFEVVEEFIKFRWNARLPIPDIDNEIKSYIFINGTSKWEYVSNVKSAVFPSSQGTVRDFNYKGNVIYYTNQWGEGVYTNNFTKFREGVSKTYPHFKIDRIK